MDQTIQTLHSRSYRHGTIPLKHGNGAMAASNFGGSHGSMMTSIPLILPLLDAPHGWLGLVIQKMCFQTL